MIKNDRQFSISQARVRRLEALLRDIEQRRAESDSPKVALEHKVVSGELHALEREVSEYRSLREGQAEPGPLRDLSDLPNLLIRTRIAARLTHAQLADLLGLKEQQIQRYEATDYESVSLSRLIEIGRVLCVEGVPLPPVSQLDSKTIWRLLEKAGVPNSLARERLAGNGDELSQAIGAVARASRIFDESPEVLLAGEAPQRSLAHAASAYKLPKRASTKISEALASYAFFLGETIARSMRTAVTPLPTDPLEFRTEVIGKYGIFNYDTVLRAFWDHGIPVVPIDEPGGFHAAYWMHGDRPVVIVNSIGSAEARWLFDVLHEGGHIAESDDPEGAFEVPAEAVRDEDPAEARANAYASDAMLAGRSEDLYSIVLDRSGGKASLLQRAVRFVARNHGVDQGALAFNVAFRLALQGEDWWGSAMNMQDPSSQPWSTARDLVISRVEWSNIDKVDADILERALAPRSKPES